MATNSVDRQSQTHAATHNIYGLCVPRCPVVPLSLRLKRETKQRLGRVPVPDACVCSLYLSLYKILFHFKALLLESILLLLPLSACIAVPFAILLHDRYAIYTPPSTLPFYAMHHTILIMAISCKGQTIMTKCGAFRLRWSSPRPSSHPCTNELCCVSCGVHRCAGVREILQRTHAVHPRGRGPVRRCE